MPESEQNIPINLLQHAPVNGAKFTFLPKPDLGPAIYGLENEPGQIDGRKMLTGLTCLIVS